MKTNSPKTNRKIWLSAAIGIAVMLMVTGSQNAVAQTNTFPSSGNVGIGTTSPTQALDVNGQMVTTGSQTLTVANKGVIEVTSTITNNALSVSALRARNTFNGNGNGPIGLDLVPTFAPSANISLARGMVVGGFFAPPSGVTISNVYGANAVTAYHDVSGAVTNGTTLQISQPIVFGALKPTTQYGLYVLNQGISGTTNSYGLYVDAQSGSTNNYAAIFAGGNVGIGTAAPSSKLHIVSGSDSPNTLLSLDTGVHGGSQFQIGGTANNESYFSMNVYRAGVYTTRFSVNSFGHVLLQPGGDGNVGVGTSSPGFKLDVQGGQANASGGLCIAGDCKTAWSQVGGSQWNNGSNSISYSAGNVGIGTSAPTVKLHVVGDGRVTGNLTVDGNIAAKYQDMAEWVPSSEQLLSGTVVVLDSTKSNQVISSSQAYDTRVAGVISEQPGIVLGEKSDDKVLVATNGRVLVQVEASKSPIHIGDLLVTSDTPGMAMKSEPIKVGGRLMHMPGTLIGKALEPLEKGSGKILVLLSLQ
ncbi:MAG: hypothetical protein QOG23_5726 [Blastocatellia bacterium]|jgi:hypothetical protein|nr:hypothetical protein [Blastocatellia bacterium]